MILEPAECTFQKIKALIGPSLALHQWEVTNGGSVKAQVKVTTRGGLVKTAYLHATIAFPNGRWIYYREQANGNFREVSSGIKAA